MGKLRRLFRFRKKKKKKKKKESKPEVEEETLEEVADDLNSMFGKPQPEPQPEPQIVETFRLTDEEKKEIDENGMKPEPNKNKLVSWVHEHVRPDVGLVAFKEGEGPDFKNDDLLKISEKLKENLKIGLKITWKF